MLNKDYIKRTNLDSLDEFVPKVVDAFNIGKIDEYKIIKDGLQELNVRISTDTGKYVLKVFSKERELTNNEPFEGDILSKLSKILKTQPEHIIKTIERFLKEIKE